MPVSLEMVVTGTCFYDGIAVLMSDESYFRMGRQGLIALGDFGDRGFTGCRSGRIEGLICRD
jgi:hypothetical protein